MPGLFGTMSIAVSGLQAQEAALQTTSENIANSNTDGYTRKRAVLAEDTTFLDGGQAVGNGVHVENIESLRDNVLELRIYDETQQQGALNSYVGEMSQVENLFSDADSGIGANLDAFFNTVSDLSTDPSNVAKRQNVLTAAGNLATSVSTSARNLMAVQGGIDSGIVQGVSEVNQLTAQIAELNADVTRVDKLGGDSGSFEDQRTELIRKLSEQIDVSVVQSDDGLTLTAGNGALLVVGNKSFNLETSPDSAGRECILSNGADITQHVSGGNLGGLLEARDKDIPSILSGLDSLAESLANSLNAANASGVGLDGDAGQAIFATPSGANAAAQFSVVMTDPRKLAASSDGTPGDNSNLAAFTAVSSDPAVAGQDPIDFYSSLVAQAGMYVSNANSDSDAAALMLQQLSNERGAISGVSLDEEAANMIQFQRAFEASARVISVIDEMLQTVLAMGTT
jgi:flagellar hook-associated protein 1